MGGMIDIDGEMWSVDELRAVLRRKHCRICHTCNHRPLLDLHQIEDIRRRYKLTGRRSNVRALAAEYGVTPRTILRYVNGEYGSKARFLAGEAA